MVGHIWFVYMIICIKSYMDKHMWLPYMIAIINGKSYTKNHMRKGFESYMKNHIRKIIYGRILSHI